MIYLVPFSAFEESKDYELFKLATISRIQIQGKAINQIIGLKKSLQLIFIKFEPRFRIYLYTQLLKLNL